MSRYQWVFRRECGCAFGVMEDRRHTQGEAWKDFFDEGTPVETSKAIGTAVARGVTTVRVTHARYVSEFMPQMLSGYRCPHTPEATAAWRHLPAGHARHAVPAAAVKALCGIGPRGTGDTWSTDARAKALPKCQRCKARISRGAS